jgi:hypothetical protein
MRVSTVSRRKKWCSIAAAAWSATSAAMSVGQDGMRLLEKARKSLSTGTKSGRGILPNHTTGKPAAEL